MLNASFEFQGCHCNDSVSQRSTTVRSHDPSSRPEFDFLYDLLNNSGMSHSAPEIRRKLLFKDLRWLKSGVFQASTYLRTSARSSRYWRFDMATITELLGTAIVVYVLHQWFTFYRIRSKVSSINDKRSLSNTD